MARKSKEVRQEAEQASARLEEIKAIQLLAEAEEAELLSSMKEKIQGLCETKGLFCGYIMNTNAVLALVKLAIENGGVVNIPFELYFKE